MVNQNLGLYWFRILRSVVMEGGESSWIIHNLCNMRREVSVLDSYPGFIDEASIETAVISMDSVLPDDVLERILAYLPIASIFRAGCVCKRWKEITPWYYMFTSSDEPIGYAYDPIPRKWYGIQLPCIDRTGWLPACSYGLVCLMDTESQSYIFVCNPVTRDCKRLEEPLGSKFSDYSAVAISVNNKSHDYTVALVKSKQVPGNFVQWDLSIQAYDSETRMWMNCLNEVLTGWRGGDESIICDGSLYFLIYSTAGGMGAPENRHALVKYNLSTRSSHDLLIKSFIPVPCPLTCGRLMNLKEKLVMVGGIGKQYRTDIIKGIGIWVLNGREWTEISRMPQKYFQGFGELDDVFASSGTGDLIYIQSYGSPSLLTFDMNHGQWKWSQKNPVTKRFPLQLFNGFCFEPRLEVLP
ncbi:hypothetical protein MKW92_007666 [Papaver armeniacum]|nr:hypothetical protein MKW92_007666 [Papaver armeniacum]